MRISVAGEDVEDNHVKQLHDVCCRARRLVGSNRPIDINLHRADPSLLIIDKKVIALRSSVMPEVGQQPKGGRIRHTNSCARPLAVIDDVRR